MPQLSIIIPAHNTAEYLPRCLDSILSQTMADFECILVENGSTDNTLQVCHQYARIDSRIKVITIGAADLSIARNRGVAIATAPHIGFVDSDDWIDPEMYATLLAALQEEKCDVAMCNYVLEYDDGRQEPIFDDSGATHIYDSREAQRLIIGDKISTSACVRVFPRKFLSDHHFPEGKYFEDSAIMYEWMEQLPLTVHIDKAMYHYYMRSNSICHTLNSRKKRFDMFEIEIDRLEYIDRHHLFEGEELHRIRNMLLRHCIGKIKEYIRVRGTKYNDAGLQEMRRRLEYCHRYTSADLTPQNRRRLNMITNRFPLYFAIKRLKQK